MTSDAWAETVRSKISDISTNLDPNFYLTSGSGVFVEDSGTSHISVLGPNGDAVSVTSTVNNLFGAGKPFY